MTGTELEDITEQVIQEFAGLSESELNLKPAEDKWSIAQCLDHIVVSNETYLPAFESLIKGAYKKTLWQRINPMTSFAGTKGLELLKAGKTKLKAPSIFEPSKDDVIKNSVARFVAHQQVLASVFSRLETAGVTERVISSPVTSVLTLKAGDAMKIITEHEWRHLRQAINVKEVCINEEVNKVS